MREELVASTGEVAQAQVAGESVDVALGDDSQSFVVEWDPLANEGIIRSGERSRRFYAHRKGGEVEIWLAGESYQIRRPDREPARAKAAANESGDVSAPMPGMVVRVLAAEGDAVESGDGLIVLESMKMQLTLSAPCAGMISRLQAIVGKMVEQGTILVTIDPKASV